METLPDDMNYYAEEEEGSIHNNNSEIMAVVMTTPPPTAAPTLAIYNENEISNTELLLSSLRLYGSCLLIGLPIYCLLRKWSPRLYAVRQWVKHPVYLISPLAKSQFGWVSWLWRVYGFDNDEDRLVEHIGLDAVCLLRVLTLGFRLALLGCLNSIWLFPVYATAPTTETENNTDPLNYVAINVLEPGSRRFLATVLGNYLFCWWFGWQLLNREFPWFIEQRHRWLKKFNARNYTVFVRNIPKEMRSTLALKQHFELLYGKGCVLQVNLLLHIAELTSAVAKRKQTVSQLEHALARFAIHQKRPIMLAPPPTAIAKGKLKLKLKTDAIDYYTKQLDQLNEDITDRLDQLQLQERSYLERSQSTIALHVDDDDDDDMDNDDCDGNDNEKLKDSRHSSEESSFEEEDYSSNIQATDSNESSNTSGRSSQLTNRRNKQISRRSLAVLKGVKHQASAYVKSRAVEARESIWTMDKFEGMAATLISSIVSEGKPDDAAFVTFRSLVTTHAALQMSQHHEPYVLNCHATPDIPEFIFWGNVGADREAIQTGQLISTAITIGICLFWTIPVTAIVNLTNAQELAKVWPTIEPTLENNPWLVTSLSNLSPILLLLLNTGLLPIVLKAVSRIEFCPSDSQLEASAFWKMCAFHIIQTFFVSMVSGSVVAELEKIIDNPQHAVLFLAESLPKRGAYFMQLLMVSTTTGSLLELFRFVPLFQAFVRSLLGWKLTAKERQENIGMFKPLNVVDKFYYSRAQARFCLYFLVMFTYTSISPLINWFCLAFFLFLGSVYRHQFIFNYPSTPDTGGEIWLYMMQVLLSIMVIAQIVLAGFLSLKEAYLSLGLLVPLIVFCVLGIFYLHQQHFKIGHYLPARAAIRKDLENDQDSEVNFDVFLDAYKNPALLQRHIDPDWDSGKDEAAALLKKQQRKQNNNTGNGITPIESESSDEEEEEEVDPEAIIKAPDNDKQRRGGLEGSSNNNLDVTARTSRDVTDSCFFADEGFIESRHFDLSDTKPINVEEVSTGLEVKASTISGGTF